MLELSAASSIPFLPENCLFGTARSVFTLRFINCWITESHIGLKQSNSGLAATSVHKQAVVKSFVTKIGSFCDACFSSVISVGLAWLTEFDVGLVVASRVSCSGGIAHLFAA